MKKKEYPPGTFLPTPQRVLAIMQLCTAFTLIMWYVGQPFMGEYFRLHSRMIVYEYVLGTSGKGKMVNNGERFTELPKDKQEMILHDYKKIQNYAQRSIFSKIVDGVNVLFLEIPAFEVAWIFFSIVITILLLKKVEGARYAVWILPLLVLGYVIDNRTSGILPKASPDEALFPTEQMIVQGSLDPTQEYVQLQKGWKKYLITHWLPKGKAKAKNVEEAEFHFTVARLERLHGQKLTDWLFSYRDQNSFFFLTLCMGWNLFFAWMLSSTMNKKIGSNANEVTN